MISHRFKFCKTLSNYFIKHNYVGKKSRPVQQVYQQNSRTALGPTGCVEKSKLVVL